MTAFLRRLAVKLAAGLVMIWAVATFTFFLVHALPGKPGDVMYEQLITGGMDPALAQARVTAMFGYTSQAPLLEQYGSYLWQLLHGNLGVSISQSGVPVLHVIWTALPWTLLPGVSGLLISFLAGVTAGTVAAIKRSSRWGGALSLSGSVVAGTPYFVFALVLSFLFHTLWGILPYGDVSDVTLEPGWNGPYISSLIVHAILPVASYALLTYGTFLLSMKGSVVSALGDDYILAAELRGIGPVMRLRYVARNAILPLFTDLAIWLGLALGGAVLIENIFNYPGLGSVLLHSIGSRDYPLMAGAFLLVTVAIVVANILADLFYSVIDPRVRRS